MDTEQEAAAEHETEPTVSHSIDDAVAEFIHDIDGIRSAEQIACPLIQALAKRYSDDFSNLVNGFKTKGIEDADDETILVPVANDKEFRKLRRRREVTSSAIYQTPRALLVAMISAFDAYLGRLLRCVFYLRPERIDSSERTLTFSQLVKLDSIDAAREHVISKEIETFLRKSHVEHFDDLEAMLDMPLRKGLESWPVFVEVTQRRNLFVHCDGIVSQQYLDVCEKNSVDLGNIQLGDRLYLDATYFANAYECLYEIGVKMSQVIWRKLAPDQMKDADDSLNSVSYDLLLLRRYKLAHNILLFGTTTLKKHSSAMYRRMLIVNRAIAAKFGDIKSDPSPLSLEDWSDCGLPFKLAIAVLNDKYDDACQLMRTIGTEHEMVNRYAYSNWPLFAHFREDSRFVETYKELFGAEFDVKNIEELSDGGTGQQRYEIAFDSDLDGKELRAADE
jgi:hypothetical protein